MTKYPSLDRYLSPLSPITCTFDPLPPFPPSLLIFLLPVLNHHFSSNPFLISRVCCITFFRNENKHRRFSQAFHDSSRRRGSEERGENELERQRRRATTSRATHETEHEPFHPRTPVPSLFFSRMQVRILVAGPGEPTLDHQVRARTTERRWPGPGILSLVSP